MLATFTSMRTKMQSLSKMMKMGGMGRRPDAKMGSCAEHFCEVVH